MKSGEYSLQCTFPQQIPAMKLIPGNYLQVSSYSPEKQEQYTSVLFTQCANIKVKYKSLENNSNEPFHPL